MISVEEARARLFEAAPRLPSETLPLGACDNRVLAEDVVARRTQPPFHASAMDGYALAHGDLPGPLNVVGEAKAGLSYAHPVESGQAVRIFTGAPLPAGADTVLIQEDATRSGDLLTATEVPVAGANVRRAGIDFVADDTLVGARTRLSPRHLALAGAGGHDRLSVARSPVVAILATGDELVPPGASAGPDQIVASVTPALAAMVHRAGGKAIDLGIAPDDVGVITERAKVGLAEADILVTLGGASVGDHDLIQPALSQLGIGLDFWKVAVRPGKPLMFASAPMVLGLPGNPVSGVVCAVLFLIPLLEAMQGVPSPGPVVEDGLLGVDLAPGGPRRDHLRAQRRGDKIFPFSTQDSSMLRVLSDADVLLVREPRDGAREAGSPCRYIRL